MLYRAGVVATATLAFLLWRRRQLRHAQEEPILVAACDLDKTVYPPAGPNQLSQLAANVAAMAAFERVGGFVFPVTGNNIPQAQVKFTDSSGSNLRELEVNPGIFCNGSLVLGPGGVELERHSPGRLRMAANPSVDFITALLDFWSAPEQRELLAGVGLVFFMPDELVCVEGCAHDGYVHVEGFCASQRVQPIRRSRAALLAERERVLQVVLLFPPLLSNDTACYEATCRPWQLRVQNAMEQQGLMKCSMAGGGGGVGDGLRLTLMKDPWPEMDICVGGVDKGSALARFLRHPAVLRSLGADAIDPASHVAVFGDAANDVPMFRAVGGSMPALRVGMPHAAHAELVRLSTHRAECSTVLESLCEAKLATRPWADLRAAGVPGIEILAARLGLRAWW